MINVAGLLKEVIRTYKLEQPVPEDVRSYMHAVKRSVLADVLRKYGNYGLYFGILLRIYFLSRSMGIAITLAKCAAVFWILVVAGAASVSAGAYALTAFIQERGADARVEVDMIRNGERNIEQTADEAIPGSGKGVDAAGPGTIKKEDRQQPHKLTGRAKPARVYGTKKKTKSAPREKNKSENQEIESKAKNIPTL